MGRSSYRIRRLTPADRPLLRDLLGRFSEQTRQQRYGSPTPLDGARAETEIARLLAHGDRDLVLVAVDGAGAPGELVGIAELRGFRGDGGGAEIAIMIRDDHQGRGAGTLLLRELCAQAHQRAVERLHAFTMVQNRPLRRLLAGVGPVSSTYLGDGTIDVVLQLPARPTTV
jgi:RimJ/RimL family protein N-acetyltransferase